MTTPTGFCGCGKLSAAPEDGVYRCHEHMGWKYLTMSEQKMFREHPDKRKRMAGRGRKRWIRRHGTVAAKAQVGRGRRYSRDLERQRMRNLPNQGDGSKGAQQALRAMGFEGT